MTKRAFIIHGWDGFPEEGWFPWLKQELEKNDFEVTIPQMPNPDEPRLNTWPPYLREIIINPDENTFLIGHSMGCQAITRFIEALPENTKVGGAVFVAGYYDHLTALEGPDEEELWASWKNVPIDFEKVKKHCLKFACVFSDNDPFVPADNYDTFKNKLDAKITIVHDKGHFSGPTDHCLELPEARDAVLEMSQ